MAAVHSCLCTSLKGGVAALAWGCQGYRLLAAEAGGAAQVQVRPCSWRWVPACSVALCAVRHLVPSPADEPLKVWNLL